MTMKRATHPCRPHLKARLTLSLISASRLIRTSSPSTYSTLNMRLYMRWRPSATFAHALKKKKTGTYGSLMARYNHSSSPK